MNESSRLVNEMSAYDVDVMTDAVNHVAQEQVITTREELKHFLCMLCDKYGGSPLVAFADYVRNGGNHS